MIADIRDALIAILRVPFGAHAVDKKFSVLEATHTGIVVSWSSLMTEPLTYTTTQAAWDISLNVFIKDEGDNDLMMDRHADAADTIVTTLLANPTIGGTVERVTGMRISNTPGTSRDTGTAVWVAFDCSIGVVEYLPSSQP